MNPTRLFAPVAALALLGACSSHQHAPHVAGKPTAAQTAMFDRIKSLQGEWVSPDENGKMATAAVFTVSSNGSVVREVMMPGTPMEMTNIYHLDGPAVVVTHYCAIGNQPTMRATAANPDGSISFTFDRVANLATPKSIYMGSLKVIFTDHNHITQQWTTLTAGKPAEEHATFTLTRKGA